jgi:hypothetical protein
MMAGGECVKWIMGYQAWSTVVSGLPMIEGRKTVMVGSEGMPRVKSGGSYNGGHYS